MAARPGPAPKGGTRLPVRFPDDHLDLYRQRAADAGLSVSEYVANLAARAAGLPEPWPSKHNSGQLPLELAAA